MKTVEQDGLGSRLLLREDPSTTLFAYVPWVIIGLAVTLVAFGLQPWLGGGCGVLAMVLMPFLVERKTRLDLRIEGATATLYRDGRRIWSGPTSELDTVDQSSGWTLVAGPGRYTVLNDGSDRVHIARLRREGSARDIPAAIRSLRTE